MTLIRITFSVLSKSFSFLIPYIVITLLNVSYANTDPKKISTTKPINVLMVNPSYQNDPFWEKTENYARHAAQDLGITLFVIHEGTSRFNQFSKIKKHLENTQTKTDYIVFSNYSGNAKAMMDYLQKMNIKVITLEQTISGNEKKMIGDPKEKYKNWISDISFNNKLAGLDLANALLKPFKKTNTKPVVAGISGNPSSESTFRNKGLISAIGLHNASMTQIVHAGWSAEIAFKQTTELLKRHPSINVIWSASDHMALAAMRASETLGYTLGKDIHIGGFDWTPQAIEKIKEGKLTASVGGHFIKGVIAMSTIYNAENNTEHHHQLSPSQIDFSLGIIDQNNVGRYGDLLNINDLSRINFKAYAQAYSSNRDIDPFHLLTLLKESITP